MKVKKIFVSKQAGIGDVILVTPVLAALKRRYPESKITLMTFPNAVDAVRGLPFIDEVFSYDKRKDSTIDLIKKIWKYDIALLLDMQYRPALLSAIAQIPIRVGITHKRKFWLTNFVPWEEFMDHVYEPYVFGDILRKTINIDIPNVELEKLYIAEASEEDKRYVEQKLQEYQVDMNETYIACSPITAHYLKNWGLDKWNQLFMKLYQSYRIKTVIFGGQKVEFSWDQEAVIDLTGQTNLRQAAFLIKKANLLVNSCSLPVHIASAVETQCVVLYGFGDSKRWAPRKKCKIVCADLPCSPCDGYHGTSCTNPRCMEEISVEDVFCACQKMIK